WHVTAFRKDYKMQGPEDTPAETLLRAAATGRAAGLRYVYAGNLPGLAGLEDTRCPGCGDTPIERRGFRVLCNRLSAGECPRCRGGIPRASTAEARTRRAARVSASRRAERRGGARGDGDLDAPRRSRNRPQLRRISSRRGTTRLRPFLRDPVTLPAMGGAPGSRNSAL